MMNILIIGNCGVGKTWLMSNLIKHLKADKRVKVGMIYYHSNGQVNVIGKYDGSIFQGSDRLSMAVCRDLDKYMELTKDQINIFEGDRFTNSTVINKTNPYIIRIMGSGAEGRLKRNSQQTERHIKSIATRVSNIIPNLEVSNSTEGLNAILNILQFKEVSK